MNDKDLAWWLIENAGPVIRYRTLREILQVEDVFLIGGALERLLDSALVKKWLERLQPRQGFHDLHSSRIIAFENVMGKLAQLGLRAGLRELDVRTIKFRAWLSKLLEREGSEYAAGWEGFSALLVASFLSFAGYDQVSSVKAVMNERLAVCNEFVSDFDSTDFYESESKREWLVAPKYYTKTLYGFPVVHDIRGFSSAKWILDDPEYRTRAENVVAMILSPPYQKLQPGYGYMKHNGRYYRIGWSVHLPGFFSPPPHNEMGKLLLSLEMMAPFRSARQSDWFRNSLGIFESARTEDGHYRFPSEWLPEKPSGYWVDGRYMALEENRRREYALDYESTFWVLLIRKRAQMF